MRDFTETEISKRILSTLLFEYDNHKEVDITDEERLVKQQKTKIYKWWCGFIWGHLMKDGVCLRCGINDTKQ